MDASARITASSRLATSDSAWTMSMGASVPISTRDLRVAQRLLREVERLLRDGQRVDREDVVPVGVLHGARRERHGLLQADVGDLAVLLRLVDLLADGVELEVAQQRLA